MATKKPAARKTTTAKVSKPATKVARKDNPAKIIYTEKHPECHKVTGKFIFFYFFFAGTTLFFAIVSVFLLINSIDMQNKYESINSCVRSHTRCHVTYDGSVYDATGSEE